MKKYTYNKQDYFSEYALRNAIFNNERKVFGEITTDAEWKKLGVTVSEYKEPEKTFDELKSEKLAELTAQALAFEDNVNKSMYFISSVFVEKEVQKDDETTETVKGHLVINGDRRTRSNLEDLITYQPTDTVTYRDYENIERQLTKEQLQVMLKEHVINGQNLYYQKWAYEEQIKACTTIEELNAIELNFVMKDFSK